MPLPPSPLKFKIIKRVFASIYQCVSLQLSRCPKIGPVSLCIQNDQCSCIRIFMKIDKLYHVDICIIVFLFWSLQPSEAELLNGGLDLKKNQKCQAIEYPSVIKCISDAVTFYNCMYMYIHVHLRMIFGLISKMCS